MFHETFFINFIFYFQRFGLVFLSFFLTFFLYFCFNFSFLFYLTFHLSFWFCLKFLSFFLYFFFFPSFFLLTQIIWIFPLRSYFSFLLLFRNNSCFQIFNIYLKCYEKLTFFIHFEIFFCLFIVFFPLFDILKKIFFIIPFCLFFFLYLNLLSFICRNF